MRFVPIDNNRSCNGVAPNRPIIYSDVKWASCCLKSPAIRLFAQQFQSDFKENIKSCIIAPFRMAQDRGIDQ